MAIQSETPIHSLTTAVNDFLVASGAGAFAKKTLAEVKTILGLGTAAYTASTAYEAAGGITTHAALRTGIHGVASSYAIMPQGNPDTETSGAVTVTIAKMLTGIVTGTPTAARAYTLDTGTNCDAGMTISANESFDWVLINLSTTAAAIITLTAAAGHTIVGNPLIASQSATTGGVWGTSSAIWRTRKTATNTFITYRIA